ncbi:MAG: hypothetical protein K8U57_12090 [Planctomycetes bacterium]|nr:hypothetical protein [Planctomycetota bacterium]
MDLLWLFRTTGPIFAALILLTGLISLILCVRATMRSSSPRRRRIAAIGSSLPVLVGVAAIPVGLIVCLANNVEVQWWALGRAFLAGVVVAIIPLVWSLTLLRKQQVVANGGT